MKKKLFTSLACAAFAVVGALGLVACGGTKDDVRFERVKGYYMGQNLDIAATNWTEDTTNVETGVNKVFKLDEGQTLAYSAEAKAAVDLVNEGDEGTGYLLCVVVTGKGDLDDAVIKISTTDLASLQVADNLETTDAQGQPTEEKDFHFFMQLTRNAESGKNDAKTVYLSIDWDGNDGEGAAVVYKFVMEAGAMTLTPAAED